MPFCLDDYFDRIGYSGCTDVNEETLCRIHRAQAMAIPFENLDIHLGRSIRIDGDSIVDKLIRRRRGGYCYELNGLLKLVLDALGFQTRCLAGRTLRGGPPYRQKSHQFLMVSLGEQEWLADLGFGGTGLIDPIPFEPGREFEQGIDCFRASPHPLLGFVLETRLDGDWAPLYGFSLESYYPMDFEMMNLFNSTHPESAFVQTQMAALPFEDGRATLRGDELRIRTADRASVQTVPEVERQDVLLRHFRIDLDS